VYPTSMANLKVNLKNPNLDRKDQRMSIAKVAAATLLALAFATQVSVSAMAEDSEKDDEGSSYIAPTSRPEHPEPNWRKDHGDKPKRHGDDDFQIGVPPMVITPNTDGDAEDEGKDSNRPKTAFKVSPPQGGASLVEGVPDVGGGEQAIEPNSAAFDPNANQPIDMQNVNPVKKTPADVFLESAQIGVGAMAAGAAVLGVAAAVRGSRFRRQAKTDFIYEVESKE
jgi:hypothetical protein